MFPERVSYRDKSDLCVRAPWERYMLISALPQGCEGSQ